MIQALHTSAASRPTPCARLGNDRGQEQSALQCLAGYVTALILCLLCLTWVLKLWRADLHVPFVYGQDGLLTAALVKGLIENSWYWQNDYLGAPFSSELYDFPMADNLHFLARKSIALVQSEWAVVVNFYYLLTFPLTMLAALFVLRHFRIGLAPAVLVSLLFTFLPYRLVRSEGHLFLTAYYLVPLMVMVALWLYLEPDKFFARRALGAIGICLLVSSAGVYYAFFACFLTFIAGAAASLDRRRLYPIGVAAVLIATLSGGVLANLAPSLIYRMQHGPNRQVATRSSAEAETYGMKLVQLLLPASEHRVSWLRELKAKYNRTASTNENDTTSLGLIGSAGFLVLIGRLLRRQSPGGPQLLDALSTLNLFAVLLATVGGFGSLCAVLLTSKIRAYNRISVYIAFLSLFAVALLLQTASAWLARSRYTRIAVGGFLAIILGVGILDQTNARQVPPYQALKEEFSNDADFIRRVEETLPSGASVFQLPYQSYPEPDWVCRMSTYEPLRGYLQSRRLRWSYGCVKGRQGDRWYTTVVEQPVDEMMRTVACAGFDGITIDRLGYPDSAAHLRAELSRQLGAEPLVSGNDRLLFFDISKYRARLNADADQDQLRQRQEAALNPLVVTWGGGFSPLEKSADESWHWCSAEGEVWIENPLPRPRRVALSLVPVTGHALPSNLIIDGLLSTTVRINVEGTPMNAEVVIPPGKHPVTFACDAPRFAAPGDPRMLVFKIKEFGLREID
jgi:hypothetical protein